MRKTILLAMLMLPTLGYSGAKFSGYIVTSDGESIWADQIATDDDDVWEVTVLHEGESIKSKINELEVDKIILIDHKDRSWFKKAIVHLIDGRQFELIDPIIYGIFSNLYYKFDPINHELTKNTFKWSDVVEIKIDSKKGEYKVDSEGHTFPPYYIFSPYTGEKLTFGTFTPTSGVASP